MLENKENYIGSVEGLSAALGGIATGIIGGLNPVDLHDLRNKVNEFCEKEVVIYCGSKVGVKDALVSHGFVDVKPSQCSTMEAWGVKTFRLPGQSIWVWVEKEDEAPSARSDIRSIVRNICSHVFGRDAYEPKYQELKVQLGW